MFCFIVRRRSLVARGKLQKIRRSFSFKTSYEHDIYYLTFRASITKEIETLPEHRAAVRLNDFLECKAQSSSCKNGYDWILPPTPPPSSDNNQYKHEMDARQVCWTLDAALATFGLHVEARIAAVMGAGFYTIGPCGEEAISAAGLCLQPNTDSLALHYRHVGVNLCRQLAAAAAKDDYDIVLHQMILDRARGYTVSKMDPVTGGVHCSIGSTAAAGTLNDYIVTSTLASQCPAAVGRALGYALLSKNDVARPISMVTIGDGSVHNHHFWSAFHLARHARHKHIKCPVVFGISDNGLSISYSTAGYVDTLFGRDDLVPLYTVNGNDILDVYSQTMEAVTYARQRSAPVVVLYKNLVRRFGHAASDRQFAYLNEKQIESMADNAVLESMIIQAVEVMGATTYSQVRDRWVEIQHSTVAAFATASSEEKVTRAEMLERVSAPQTVAGIKNNPPNVITQPSDRGIAVGKREVMRKHMTRVIAETMQHDESVVYLGEDVIHGGYYVVTDGLAEQFPGRVLDFPPDETSLLGAALGFSNIGLLPIVEIPYAKYLDCGADMFHEIAVLHWLSAGKHPVGMVIRLQGFDRGLFGGNFHTSNVLSIPPGVDVCCFSSGEDYVMGFRNAIRQAKAGRVVMSVDCTNLLNQRHLYEKDRGWERSYPEKNESNILSFDTVRMYGTRGKWAIVTYGNGVFTSLQARRSLFEQGVVSCEADLDIIDCIYLSRVPDGLRCVIGQYQGVLFADICKEGPGGNVLSSMACSLRTEGLLNDNWEHVAAPRTYNPLGSIVTFLNTDDVVRAFQKLLKTAATT